MKVTVFDLPEVIANISYFHPSEQCAAPVTFLSGKCNVMFPCFCYPEAQSRLFFCGEWYAALLQSQTCFSTRQGGLTHAK